MDRFGHRRAMVAGYLLMAACAAGFALVDGLGPALWTLRVAQGLATSIESAACLALVCAVAPAGRLGQSADTGPANGLLHLGMMSVFLFGALANHTEFALVFVLAGALVAASAIFFIPGGSPSKRTVAKASTG